MQRMARRPARSRRSCSRSVRGRRGARASAARLRIFFGASAGRRQDLRDARGRAQRCARTASDVVVGYVEPHGRVETEALLEGLEQLPRSRVELPRHRCCQEFDLDAALARQPGDPARRRARALELVGGEPAPRIPSAGRTSRSCSTPGIDVWTTRQRAAPREPERRRRADHRRARAETVPDRVFDEADEVELIDLPPDDLLARLRPARSTCRTQARARVERFFRKANLIALRELALRRMAERVEAGAREHCRARPDRARLAGARSHARRHRPGRAGASSSCARGKRMADALDAEWTVVYVETPALLRLSEKERNRRIDAAAARGVAGRRDRDARRADRGARRCSSTRTTRNVDARARRRAEAPRLARLLRALDRDAAAPARAQGFDVIDDRCADRAHRRRRRGAAGAALAQTQRSRSAGTATRGRPPSRSRARGRLRSMYPYFEPANLVMVYLLGVHVAGLRFGRGPSVLTAVLNVAVVRFLLRAAAVHLRRVRRAVPGHVRRDAGRRARDRAR